VRSIATRCSPSACDQYLLPATATFHLLPADLDAATLPPAGSPKYFVAWLIPRLELFSFHVDFSNPF